jgi:hypothetical protein
MLMLIPGLLHVPIPQADFHVIRHHHGYGEVCPHHDHLLRWHPQAGESEDVAVLHWHWLLPQSLDVLLGEPNPALHAHVNDILQPEWNGDQAVISSEACIRAAGSLDLATWLDLALIDVGAPRAPGQPPRNAWAGPRGHDGLSPATSSAQLVRWNC